MKLNAELWQSPLYRQIVDKIEALRPLVPDYDPKADNTDQWKFESAKKQMHDLVLKILKPENSNV